MELDSWPEELVQELVATGASRASIVTEPEGGRPRAHSPVLEPLANYLAGECPEFRGHEALFFGVGEQTRSLFGVFIHHTQRGQAQGGVRYWPYASLRDFVLDGLRLSTGMGRKCALAGLWWGGGKGVIARRDGDDWRDPAFRRVLYGEFGRFVTSLAGCYVTAEDAGTTPDDMAEIYRHTRFVTCIPTALGGSGNPSKMTSRGVLCAMEAALDSIGLGSLAGVNVAMQGAGNVGSDMIEGLLAAGVERIVVSELSHTRQEALQRRFSGAPLSVRRVDSDDVAILAEPCDVLVPNGLGGVLGPETIPLIQARVVCGAANNQLLDDERDAALLEQRGVTYVPDFVANRMGIVACSNEHAGHLLADPEIARHLDRTNEDSIYQVTQRILQLADSSQLNPVSAANRLADERARQLHPIWGHRARAIIESLVASGWDNGAPVAGG